MTIKEETYTVPARTAKRTVSVTCDICKTEHPGAKVTHEGHVEWSHEGHVEWSHEGHVEWSHGYHETHTTTIRVSKGDGGQYGGLLKIHEFHVCPKCFGEHLLPFLKTFGLEPIESRIDW